MIKKIIFFSFLFAIVSCTTQQAVDTGKSVGTVILNEKAAAGKMIYDSNCGKCHALPDKSAYIAAKGIATWTAISEKMIKNIDEKDKTQLLNLRTYLYN